MGDVKQPGVLPPVTTNGRWNPGRGVSRRQGGAVAHRGVSSVATLLRVLGVVVAAILVVHILLVVLGANPANPVASMLAHAAGVLSLGMGGLFAPGNPELALVVNYGIAAVLWIVITSIVVAVLRRIAPRGAPQGALSYRRDTDHADGSTPDPEEPNPSAAELDGRSAAGPESDGQPEPANPAAVSPTRRSRRKLYVAAVVVIVLALAAGGGAYFNYTSHFVSTDNAQVDGDKIDINAPTTGTLTDWTLNQGSAVHRDQVVGRIEILGSFAQPQMTIKSPGDGTVAVNNGINGSFVTAGTELATAYDFAKIYVTARVDETDIDDVHPGQLVDIDVDAYPGTPVTGTVQEIQGAAAGVFSLFPQSNSSGNFQKVTQVIPVKIALTNTNGVALVPGMNVTVHIHKS
jgi:biotin carboxyl carrier protein